MRIGLGGLPERSWIRLARDTARNTTGKVTIILQEQDYNSVVTDKNISC